MKGRDKYTQYKKQALSLVKEGLSNVEVMARIKQQHGMDIPSWRITQWRNPRGNKIVRRDDGLDPQKVIAYLQSVAMFLLEKDNIPEARKVAEVTKILERKSR